GLYDQLWVVMALNVNLDQGDAAQAYFFNSAVQSFTASRTWAFAYTQVWSVTGSFIEADQWTLNFALALEADGKRYDATYTKPWGAAGGGVGGECHRETGGPTVRTGYNSARPLTSPEVAMRKLRKLLLAGAALPLAAVVVALVGRLTRPDPPSF